MSIIEIKNLCKNYGRKPILDNFSLSIEQGDFVAIMGESGKGKSTLLNIIGLLENYNSGTIIIDGEKNIKPNSLKSTKILRNKLSYLFQNFALIENESVNYNLQLALKYVDKPKKEKQHMIDSALTKVGLKGYEKYKIYELSGGEQQRIAIARLILKPSKIILADEPTGSLDADNRDAVISLLRDLNNDGKTILLVTHDKYVANRCNKIINL
ncbi:ABC transporter ATP-binding protein [Clostridium sp. M14]|uniref:ABC transporter ATP-binding protein n=1 Tax=Clostridium sp. M14 TaxID=2716311 RepID=UPI001652297C|nr:ABC transporter ATP-binding protein [Clostridium sp. M14]MBZ9693431.1 ABC transporter ATP-binding protein [Clostridium sp. M14]